jgi:hypothetical protein
MAVTLPRVLAGPLVRRVSPHQVHLWIATSERFAVTAEIFTLPKPPSERTAALQDAKLRAKYLYGDTSAKGAWSRTVQLGKRLFVSLCRLTPSPAKKSFPLDELLFYDLRLDGKDLSQFGLLGTADGIAYPGAPLPAFFIPERLTTLLHGSCHKLHGEGGDARTYADHLIRETFEEPAERPAALLLTGDQIYGDDVAEELSPQLAELAKALLDDDELLPGRPRTLTNLQAGERRTIASDKSLCWFTSSDLDHHALGFGEFAALHLLSWGPDLWTGLTVKQRDLVNARTTSLSVRRALANITTYMMFDDHDVTDDWNLNPDWKAQVSSLELGRRVIANALAAYWALQGWGNDPDAFDATFVRSLEQHLKGRARTNKFDDLLWGHPRWMYVTPTNPVVLALDLRTRRAAKRRPPDATEPLELRKNSYEEKEIGKALARSGFKKQQPLIVISSLPVIGFAPVEALQLLKFEPRENAGPDATLLDTGLGIVREVVLSKEDAAGVDWEGWPMSRTGRPRLLRFLKNVVQPSQCIFLSGDVHYGFAASGVFVEPKVPNELAVLQLTASSLKNQDEETLKHEWLGPTVRNWTIFGFGRNLQKGLEFVLGAELSDAALLQMGWGWETTAPAPHSGRIKEIVEELSSILQRLRTLAGDDPERPLLAARQTVLLEELSRHKVLLRDQPVVLSSEQADALAIQEEPSWQLFYNYTPFSPRNQMAVGLTNIGIIRLELPERIVHSLVSPMEGAFRVLEQRLPGIPKVGDYSKSLIPKGAIR